MKTAPFFLVGLVLVTLFNLALDLQAPLGWRQPSTPPPEAIIAATDDQSYLARLNETTDPVELRALARREHLRGANLLQSAFRVQGAFRLMNRARLLRSLTVLILAVGASVTVLASNRSKKLLGRSNSAVVAG